MTDYVISSGRSSSYPAHFGAHATGTRFTVCEAADFAAAFSANVLAIPNLAPVMLKSTAITVPDSFFGSHVYIRDNDSATGVTFKTVRSHDIQSGKGRWKYIETSDDVWDFSVLDAWVNTHYAAGRDLVFTLYGTPTWASARPTEEGIYGPYNLGTQAEPADMAKWDRFCAKIATRYLGKIKYYEVWNESNLNNNGTTTSGSSFFFSGTFAKLAEMTRRANQAIKAVDPTAKILCSSTTGWGTTAGGGAETYFTGMMAAATGDGSTAMKNWVDIVAVHLYGWNRSAANLAGMIDRVKAAMTAAGISGKEIWDTESAPLSPNATDLNDAALNKLIGRELLICAAKGVSRTIYYQHDSPAYGFMDRPAVVAYRENLVSLLKSGTILTISKFPDGRAAYYTAAGGLVIV